MLAAIEGGENTRDVRNARRCSPRPRECCSRFRLARPAAIPPLPPFETDALDLRSRRDHHRPGLVRGASMDVGDWLRSLGLAQYEAAFRENEIDGAVLPKLTAEDLKDLGVASLVTGGRLCRLSQNYPQVVPLLPLRSRRRRSPRGRPAVHRFRRAPAAHRDVLRPRRLDRDVGAARSRGYARDHRELSSLLRDLDRAQRRLRRQVHG